MLRAPVSSGQAAAVPRMPLGCNVPKLSEPEILSLRGAKHSAEEPDRCGVLRAKFESFSSSMSADILGYHVDVKPNSGT